jgi:hypothetical protein
MFIHLSILLFLDLYIYSIYILFDLFNSGWVESPISRGYNRLGPRAPDPKTLEGITQHASQILVGGWPPPLKNMSSSMRRIIPYNPIYYGQIIQMFQTTNMPFIFYSYSIVLPCSTLIFPPQLHQSPQQGVLAPLRAPLKVGIGLRGPSDMGWTWLFSCGTLRFNQWKYGD